MLKQYSRKINKLLEYENNTLLIPDLILVKEGISCGDQIIIAGEIDDGILSYNFCTIKACALSKAVCNYLQQKYNKKEYDVVLREIKKMYSSIENDNNYIFKLFDLDEGQYFQRADCLISPIKLMISFLKEIKNTNYNYSAKPDTHKNMECDACVGACRINWKNQKVEKSDHHKNKTYTTEYLQKWLPLGKIILNDKDKKQLKEACSNMTNEDHQFLSDCTMNSFVFYHLTENFPELLDERWKAAAYLIQKNEITIKYFEEIKKYIMKNELNIYFVKGYVSQKYYKEPSLRIHSDYDLIATNSKDAFKLTSYLLKNGFTIRPNLFSFKKMHHGEETTVSGHFHVQKIIDDTYMFELDITFPGFPINRVDLFFPRVNKNEISIEDQIIVTLLHLFKHSNIYMKDINDLYYMLNQELDLIYLKEKIIEYDLYKFFSLAIMYIYKEYPVNEENFGKIIKIFKINTDILNDYPNWPYDKKVHLKVKQEDFNNRAQEKQEYERKYLFPVVIFKKEYDFINLDEVINKGFKTEKILDNIYEIKTEDYIFYLTSIGIFIDNYIDTKNISRKRYLNVLEDFIELINKKDFYPISYATEHFYVRVI